MHLLSEQNVLVDLVVLLNERAAREYTDYIP